MDPNTRGHIALIAFFAWVGLGADGLSSAAYGPELGYLALGTHARFGLYLALATAVTVFIISLAYNQVIELFPSGGGGYKVATQLIGPKAGLVSGAALIAFFAWVGLGADGLSSAAYGPELGFLALGGHAHFGFFIKQRSQQKGIEACNRTRFSGRKNTAQYAADDNHWPE